MLFHLMYILPKIKFLLNVETDSKPIRLRIVKEFMKAENADFVRIMRLRGIYVILITKEAT